MKFIVFKRLDTEKIYYIYDVLMQSFRKVSHWLDGKNLQRLSGSAGLRSRNMHSTARMQVSAWMAGIFMRAR